jgi:thioester reductase-like protein
MFDEGQDLPSAYHATKFVAERVVREDSTVPWRGLPAGRRRG